MNILKNIFASIGVLAIIFTGVLYNKIGALDSKYSISEKLDKIDKLDPEAIPAYLDLFNTVLETGDASKGMILKYKVLDDVSNEDVQESIEALSQEHNMILTSVVKMFTKKDAKDTEVKHARIFSVCSLSIAKKFLNYSPEFGGFMPCRIMLIEYGNGDRFLFSMDLKLMIHGGAPLPTEMFKLASTVDKAMRDIPARAAEGDF
jgi:uncharacterized protein (DUF302 family)